jgi:hypothetical protein
MIPANGGHIPKLKAGFFLKCTLGGFRWAVSWSYVDSVFLGSEESCVFVSGY